MSSMAASKDAAFPCTFPRNWFPKFSVWITGVLCRNCCIRLPREISKL